MKLSSTAILLSTVFGFYEFNLESVESALRHISQYSSQEIKPIQHAAFHGHFSAIQEILQNSATKIDRETATSALLMAAGKGNVRVLDALLKDSRFAPTTLTESDDRYLWGFAIRGNQPNVVSLLLKDGRIDPSIKNNYPIQLAAREGKQDIFELLIKDPRVDPSDIDNYALKGAIFHNNDGQTRNIIWMLLNDQRVDPSAGHNIILKHSLFNADDAITKKILKDPRVDPNVDDFTIFKVAGIKGKLDLFKEMVLDPRGNLYIIYSLINCIIVDLHGLFLKELGMSGYPSTNDFYNYLLEFGAEKDNINLVSALLESPHLKTISPTNQALIKAAENGNVALVKLLLPRLDPTSLSLDGKVTAIQVAKERGIHESEMTIRNVVNALQKTLEPHHEEALKNAVSRDYQKVIEMIYADPRVDRFIKDVHH